MGQWEYLEVLLDLAKKTWRDSEGRRGKLRKSSVALALNELGLEGWELAAALTENGSAHRLLFKRPWTPERQDAAAADGDRDAQSAPDEGTAGDEGKG